MDRMEVIMAGLLSSYYFKVVSRISMAVIIGGFVGFERESKNRPAGFRTHILVCVGACSLMILSDVLFIQYYNEYGVFLDPQRIGAQVISGIGFLGAGTIIHFGNSIRGLTTAASIWTVAAIGLICGAGLFFLAIFTFLTVEIVLYFFTKHSSKFIYKTKTPELFITIVHSSKVIGRITMFFAERGIEILDITFTSFKEKKVEDSEHFISKIRLVPNLNKAPFELDDLIKELETETGVISVEK